MQTGRDDDGDDDDEKNDNNKDRGLPWWLRRLSPPAMQETWARSLGREDPLEKEMATHSSIPAWENPWTEEPGELQFHGIAKSPTRLKDIQCW